MPNEPATSKPYGFTDYVRNLHYNIHDLENLCVKFYKLTEKTRFH